ncbi:Uncharacterised protein [Moraxella cuniculi]|uniref:Uncharacterized protein n=1 Tax=Moraxella cuniculi TaxID=34061 RepID=A0A3S4SY16_9GAMM|nr:Uncharacterised protein [Moraxella cuniculi]
MTADNAPIINDTGLTTLVLLIAKSHPDNKETLIKLVVHMRHKHQSLNNLNKFSY